MKFLGLLFFSFNIFAQSSYIQFEQSQKMKLYTVKKGDCISSILRSQGYKNIYEYQHTKKHLNPIHLIMWKNGLKKSDLKKLQIGQQIYLPVKGDRTIASENDNFQDIPFSEVKKKVEEMSQEENSLF